MRDSVVTLNSNVGDRELSTIDLTGLSADTTEAFMVSGIQNINIDDSSSSNIMANDDSSMRTIEQVVPTEGQDQPTTMKPA